MKVWGETLCLVACLREHVTKLGLNRFTGPYSMYCVCISASHIFPDPRSFLVQYLGFRDARFSSSPFSLGADGSIPTRAWFLQRFRLAFPSSAFSGHSLRAGVPPAQIQAIGHWSSPAWQRYVRKHPALLQALLFHGRPIHDPPYAPL